TVEEARRRDLAERLAQDGPDGGGERGKHAAAGARTPEARTPAAGVEVVREHHTVPAAAAVVPQHPAARRAASREQGGFDFFGTGAAGTAATAGTGAGAPKAIAAAPASSAQAGKPDEGELAGADLADVVGDEAVAEQELRKGDSGEVIDLTVHDETEQIDVAELRTAIS
ncbi:hypothetical protein ACFU99_27180, partial [Streptomyces sp. NPDC057654]